MSSDIQWKDLYEGPPGAHYWVSTISCQPTHLHSPKPFLYRHTVKGKPLARARAKGREEARDKAAYTALTAIHIPVLYPDNSYPFTNCTARFNDYLIRLGKTGALTWETERLDNGKSWESVLLSMSVQCPSDRVHSYLLFSRRRTIWSRCWTSPHLLKRHGVSPGNSETERSLVQLYWI